MATKTKCESEKMVLVEGMWIAESKADGRRAAKADERRRHNEMLAALSKTRRDEVRKLKDENWSEADITQKFLREETEAARSRGFIEVTPRIRRTSELPYGEAIMFH